MEKERDAGTGSVIREIRRSRGEILLSLRKECLDYIPTVYYIHFVNRTMFRLVLVHQ